MTQTREDRGEARKPLPAKFWLSQQNLQEEIEDLRYTLERLEGQAEDAVHPALRECVERFRVVDGVFQDRLSIFRTLYIWEEVHAISQRLYRVYPAVELFQQWEWLKSRLASIPVRDRGSWTDETVENVNSLFADGVPVSAKEIEVRHYLEGLHKFLNDRSDAALWRALSANWNVAVLSCLLIGHTVLFVYRLPLPASGNTPVEIADKWNMVVAGSLGATVSSIMLLLRPRRTKGLPLMRAIVNLSRPVVGGVMAVFFLLVLHSGVVQVTSSYAAYAIAFTFGFSERLFLRSLRTFAARTEEQWWRTPGPDGKSRRKGVS